MSVALTLAAVVTGIVAALLGRPEGDLIWLGAVIMGTGAVIATEIKAARAA
jgi:hypothetical protein